MNFTVNNINYNFNDEDNKEIPNYNWFIDYFKTGEWETDTFNIFNNVKNPKKTAVDIGAWIGPTTIWLSKNFDSVISIEADRNAIFALKRNLKNNECDNVTIVEKAIFNNSTDSVYFGKNVNSTEGHGDSMSQSKLNKINDDDYLVETTTVSDILTLSDEISFIKIDIEGGEENILEDLITLSHLRKISIWISFHYEWWSNKNLNRYQHLLPLISKITFNETVVNIDEFFDKIIQNPFGSFFLEF